MTRNTIKFSAAVFLLLLLVISCKKESISISNPIGTSTPFKSINTVSNFGWNNSNKLNFNFTGLPDKNYNSILKVLGSDSSIIFQKLQNGSVNYSTTITIPTIYNTITVIFGDVQKTFITKNGTITMNLN